MGIWKAFFNNTRKPEGLLGQVHGGQYEPRPCRPRGLGPQPFAGNRSGSGSRSWAAAAVGTFGRFCENIRLQLLLLWTIQK